MVLISEKGRRESRVSEGDVTPGSRGQNDATARFERRRTHKPSDEDGL